MNELTLTMYIHESIYTQLHIPEGSKPSYTMGCWREVKRAVSSSTVRVSSPTLIAILTFSSTLRLETNRFSSTGAGAATADFFLGAGWSTEKVATLCEKNHEISPTEWKVVRTRLSINNGELAGLVDLHLGSRREREVSELDLHGLRTAACEAVMNELVNQSLLNFTALNSYLGRCTPETSLWEQWTLL